MSQSMINAAVTMNQLQLKMDQIGNNLANSNTNGYKTRNTEFSSLLYRQMDNLTNPANAEGRLTPDGIRTGTGAKAASMKLDFANGAIQTTNRALDAALTGENLFFQLQDDAGETVYTRDGAFYLSPAPDGMLMLVTADGDPVLGGDGPIMIEEGFDSIFIRDNGEIVTVQDGEAAVAGELAVVEITLPHLLEASGDNQFRLPDLGALGFAMEEIVQAPADGATLLEGGALEKSNVDIAKQMTDLITAQRAYQLNARTLTMGDHMMGLISQLRS